jgi:hypothetical protein
LIHVRGGAAPGFPYWSLPTLRPLNRAFVDVARDKLFLKIKIDGSLWIHRRRLERAALLGSGLIDYSQKMTAAAMQIAEK